MDFAIEAEWPIWHRATAVRVENQTQTLTGTGSLILVFDKELGLVKTHWASNGQNPLGQQTYRTR
jgi:hypothetical protein